MRHLFALLLLATHYSLLATPLVIATNPILQSLTRDLAPKNAGIRSLIPNNSDPHAYEPKPADIRLLAQADLIILNGLNYEPQIQKLIANSGTKARILTASDNIPLILDGSSSCTHNHDHSAHAKSLDPHAWQSVQNILQYARNIASALQQLYPDNSSAIAQNLSHLEQQLRSLETDARATISKLSPARRQLVTSHDSLAYLARDLGLIILPIAGASTEQEPNARDLARLIDRIRRDRIPAIFIDTTANPKLARLIAQETNASIPPPLYTDTLPENLTIPQMFRHNLTLILNSLQQP